MRAIVTIAVVVAVFESEARACDRALSPFETAEVAAAAADLVVTGEVTLVNDKVATVKVASALKGSAKAGDDVQIRGVTLMSDMDRCGGFPIEVGKKYVFL